MNSPIRSEVGVPTTINASERNSSDDDSNATRTAATNPTCNHGVKIVANCNAAATIRNTFDACCIGRPCARDAAML